MSPSPLPSLALHPAVAPSSSPPRIRRPARVHARARPWRGAWACLAPCPAGAPPCPLYFILIQPALPPIAGCIHAAACRRVAFGVLRDPVCTRSHTVSAALEPAHALLLFVSLDPFRFTHVLAGNCVPLAVQWPRASFLPPVCIFTFRPFPTSARPRPRTRPRTSLSLFPHTLLRHTQEAARFPASTALPSLPCGRGLAHHLGEAQLTILAGPSSPCGRG